MLARFGSSKSSGPGITIDRHDLGRVGPPADLRRDVGRIDDHLFVEDGAVIGGERLPILDGGLELGPNGRVGAACHVLERGLVRGDEAGFGTAFDRHVADRHAAFHRHVLEDVAAVLDDLADTATGADHADHVKDHVLRGDSRSQFAVDRDRHRAGSGLGQRLGGEHVLDLAVPMPNAIDPNAPWVAV